MKKAIMAIMVLALSAGAYAAEFDSLSEVKTDQLKASSSEKNLNIAPVAVEQDADAGEGADPAELSELKSQCHKHHNNWPGCPGYCNAHPMHVSCRPPAYCHTNPSGYGCPKALDMGMDAYADDDGYNKNQCHKHHNNWPGCPGYCNAHPMHSSCRPPAYCHTNPSGYGCPKAQEDEKGLDAAYVSELKSIQLNQCHKHHNNWPGCPGYCNAHPMHSSCRPPAYCHTNPSGYGCPKAQEDEKGLDAAYVSELKSIQLNQCHKHHNNWPGCPGYCNAHPMHASCRPPAYCHTNPSGFGCPKSLGVEKGMEEEGLDAAISEDDAKSICSKHHMRPGCPMFCQVNPMHKSCGHKPAYCHTNPNGYGCK
ncbi:MAG TPA: hypothetical protein PLL10_04755 [Elusimicrobiales bacterium]|nr:hypothetical protein [Elusimicrobiales bacterium]